jgi:hypothetical protein
VVALKSLPDTKAAKDTWAKRIWKRIQGLGEAAPEPVAKRPAAATGKGKASTKATGGAQATKGAHGEGKAGKKASPAKAAPKAKKSTKTREASAGPRDGSKMAQVIALMQRKGGVTITEVMDKMAGKNTPSEVSWRARSRKRATRSRASSRKGAKGRIGSASSPRTSCPLARPAPAAAGKIDLFSGDGVVEFQILGVQEISSIAWEAGEIFKRLAG